MTQQYNSAAVLGGDYVDADSESAFGAAGAVSGSLKIGGDTLVAQFAGGPGIGRYLMNAAAADFYTRLPNDVESGRSMARTPATRTCGARGSAPPSSARTWVEDPEIATEPVANNIETMIQGREHLLDVREERRVRRRVRLRPMGELRVQRPRHGNAAPRERPVPLQLLLERSISEGAGRVPRSLRFSPAREQDAAMRKPSPAVALALLALSGCGGGITVRNAGATAPPSQGLRARGPAEGAPRPALRRARRSRVPRHERP